MVAFFNSRVWERTTEHAVPYYFQICKSRRFWKTFFFRMIMKRMRMRHGMIVKRAEDKWHTHIKMVKGRGKSLWDERKRLFLGMNKNENSKMCSLEWENDCVEALTALIVVTILYFLLVRGFYECENPRKYQLHYSNRTINLLHF